MSWWKDAVIYQIYPRSFYDSNGDGIGDLEGIIQKLDYLNDGTDKSLGIDAIWLSPIYPSPMYDFGYDISDYNSIDSVFGDLKIFQKLIKEAHKRKIKIIMDLVVNHTSHLHPWFLDSRSSINSEKRDWYIWKDPVDGQEPNNFLGTFGGKAWTMDEKTGQYYYHSFLAEQPDLNWRNPAVKEEIFKMIRYWLDMKVDGFRLDVVNLFYKDDQWRDNPSRIFKGIRPFDRQVHIYDRDRPEMHDLLRDLRKLLDSYKDRMSVGEVMMDPPGKVSIPASYYGNNDELHMAFNFAFLYSFWGAGNFKKVIDEWEDALGEKNWPNYTLSNHDFRRHFSRYADGKLSFLRAKLTALMLLTLRGTPFLYYGEEIGMESERVPKKNLQDPVGIRYWPFHPGRDSERKPMCWDASEFGGFSKRIPWLPVYSKFQKRNVETAQKEPDSLWCFYRDIIKLRKSSKALKTGTIETGIDSTESFLYYTRSIGKEKSHIILNFSSDEKIFHIPADWKPKNLMMDSYQSGILKKKLSPAHEIILLPYQALLWEG
ncbi:alpha-glucosidase [Leptospira sp. GIMC2001]|uniref:alpha-glucosidase n=1 Tax=Leptospira sp. GIMC2001 TaxID=1513297 RepID=UPI002348FF7C|nr:alpha-glucosidase [Leptospira sp. GIMC2001]WCL49369.1 alpha-glucosidase [Leptospira sp. GIMC2001]